MLFFIVFGRDSNDFKISSKVFPFVSGIINAPNKALATQNPVKTDQTYSTPKFEINEGYILRTININSYPQVCTSPLIVPKTNRKLLKTVTYYCMYFN